MAGGQKLDKFVNQHFLKVGEKNPKTHRWSMKCHHCIPDAVMEHCELRCTECLPKYEQCPNAPEPVWQEALQWLATKHGLLSSVPIKNLANLQEENTCTCILVRMAVLILRRWLSGRTSAVT